MISYHQQQEIQTALTAIQNVFANMPDIGEPVDYNKLESIVFSLNPLTQRLVTATHDTDLQRIASLVEYHASQYLASINGDDLDLIDQTAERLNAMIFAFNMVFIVARMAGGEL